MMSLRNKSVLVVEDDRAMLRALEKVLKSEGASVTCAEETDTAIEVLTQREKRIDLVITDLRLPVLTGMTLVYAINEIFPSLPVIVLTAFGSPQLKAECLQQGARAVLEKPLDTPQLLEAIQKAFTRPEGSSPKAVEVPT